MIKFKSITVKLESFFMIFYRKKIYIMIIVKSIMVKVEAILIKVLSFMIQNKI